MVYNCCFNFLQEQKRGIIENLAEKQETYHTFSTTTIFLWKELKAAWLPLLPSSSV